MKILHTADWHVGRTIRGRSRADEHRAVLAEIVQIAHDQEVDLAIVAGDLFDSAAPSPESEEIVYAALLALADSGAQVIVVAGNHDNPWRLKAVQPLLDRAAQIHAAATLARPDQGGVIQVETRSGQSARVVLFPFLSQRQIVRASDLMGEDAKAHAESYDSRCRGLLEQLCGGFDESCVNLVVAHLMVQKAEPGGGERSVHSGLDYQIPAAAFPTRFVHYVALGHVHKAQSLNANIPIWYSGSPLHLDFGDTDRRKCVLLIEATLQTPATTRRVFLESGRRLRELKGSFAQLEQQAEGVGQEYLRVVLEGPPRVGLADEVRALLPNTVEVRLAESPQAGSVVDYGPPADRTPQELFAEFLQERGRQDERLSRLFEELLEEVYEAEAS